jgi:hypothetical protein
MGVYEIFLKGVRFVSIRMTGLCLIINRKMSQARK